MNLLTPNSEVRTFLNHLVGTSSKEDHDTGTFTVVSARLTLDKKRVSIFSVFQGKGESLRELLILTELVITYQSLQGNTLRTVHWQRQKFWFFSKETPTILQLSISSYSISSPATTASVDMSVSWRVWVYYFLLDKLLEVQESVHLPSGLFDVCITIDSQEQ